MGRQGCFSMAACCDHSPNTFADALCQLAAGGNDGAVCQPPGNHPAPPAVVDTDEVLALQICEADCSVEFRCNEQGACMRYPSGQCNVTEPTPCAHYEKCDDFKNEEDPKRKGCFSMAACCDHSPNTFADALCQLAAGGKRRGGMPASWESSRSAS